MSNITSSRSRFRAALLTGAALVMSVGLPAVAGAQTREARSEATSTFNIPAGPLPTVLSTWASATGLQYAYPDNGPSVRSPGVRGRMTADQALTALLSGTGYRARYTAAGVVTLERADAAAVADDGSRMLGAVRVEGSQSPYNGGAGQAAGVNGVNGSNDITATEGTGSFTSGALTIGSKMPQAMKDVPQSLSVLTSERMEQQNVTDFTTALKHLPGITLVQGATSLENTFYSRGFAITSIQVDGGAPLATALADSNPFGFSPQIDMSIYDHVELLRGAAGLLNGYGSPSGTVNLVRKKPLDHAQFTLETQVGSWQNYRVVADATSPLALDGALRGRLVMTYQDRHYFYDTAKDNKTLIYGIAELDATPTTLVTAGASYTRQDSVPWSGGLPRYQTGEDLELPRSTCLCFEWNRWDFDTTEIFGGVEQKLGGEWTAKLNLTWNRQQSTQKVGYSLGAVNPETGAGPRLAGSYIDYASDQFSAEAVLTGAFELFGQRQEVTIGANRVSSDGGGLTSYQSPITSSETAPYQPYPGGPIYCTTVSVCPSGVASPPIDVFHFDPRDPNYTEPRNPLASYYYPVYGQVQSGAYMNLRLTAFDRLHLTTGLRWSRYEYENTLDYMCTDTTSTCAGKQIGDIYYTSKESYSDDDISWPPPVNLSFDVTKQISAYLGYTDIYQSQANYLDVNHNPLGPVTGSNWEAGVKWVARDGRLNLSFAAYRIQQEGFGTTYNPTEEVSPGVYCCLVSDPNQTKKSEGVDIEATGELISGWQVAASYTFNQNEYEGSSYGTYEGKPLLSIQPKHLYKLWMSYDFGRAGHGGALSRLTLSGGVNGQSSAYYSGSVCVNLNDPNPVTGVSTCKSRNEPDTVPYEFTVPAYAVVSARIDYRFSDTWSLAVNLENILDEIYYQTVGQNPTSGNWYGAPRSYTATLRARF